MPDFLDSHSALVGDIRVFTNNVPGNMCKQNIGPTSITPRYLHCMKLLKCFKNHAQITVDVVDIMHLTAKT